MMITPRIASVLILASAALLQGRASAAGGESPASGAHEWDPRTFGAVADARTLDTVALQKAIDAARDAGGGTVRVKAGTYLTGTLDLRSGVTLRLDKGAVILGSPHIVDYRRGYWPALIKADSQDHVAISGEGTIDGQGQLVAEDTFRIRKAGTYLDFFPDLKDGYTLATTDGTGLSTRLDPRVLQRQGKLDSLLFATHEEGNITRANEFVRPQVLEFRNCRDVRVSGVTLRNSACWVETYRQCEDVAIEGITVRSTAYWNNDGVDIVDSRRVRIEHCDIDAADDGICLKSETVGHICEDISVADCRIRSSASALKLGTASYGGFRHIRVHGIDVHDTFRSAAAIESVDGGVLEDVEVDGVTARNTGNAFFVRLGHRSGKEAGAVRHVILSNFNVEVPAGKPDAGYAISGPALLRPVNLLPSSVAGLPGHPVEDVVLRNITIVYAGGARRDLAEAPLNALDRIPEQEHGYPEFSMFGELPAWGLYLRHASGVRLENVTLKFKKHDFRSSIVADDVSGLALDQVRIESAGEEPVLVLHRVKDETARNVDFPADARESTRRM